MQLTRKQQLWLNDVSLPESTPKEDKAARLEAFMHMRSLGITVEQLKDEGDRKEYAAWLEADQNRDLS